MLQSQRPGQSQDPTSPSDRPRDSPAHLAAILNCPHEDTQPPPETNRQHDGANRHQSWCGAGRFSKPKVIHGVKIKGIQDSIWKSPSSTVRVFPGLKSCREKFKPMCPLSTKVPHRRGQRANYPEGSLEGLIWLYPVRKLIEDFLESERQKERLSQVQKLFIKQLPKKFTRVGCGVIMFSLQVSNVCTDGL